jgi:glycosyltransferase involved in cell wall biosynthesis
MARYAVEILTNPVLAAQMGEKGRADALNRFNRDAIISQYESVYEEVRHARCVPA